MRKLKIAKYFPPESVRCIPVEFDVENARTLDEAEIVTSHIKAWIARAIRSPDAKVYKVFCLLKDNFPSVVTCFYDAVEAGRYHAFGTGWFKKEKPAKDQPETVDRWTGDITVNLSTFPDPMEGYKQMMSSQGAWLYLFGGSRGFKDQVMVKDDILREALGSNRLADTAEYLDNIQKVRKIEASINDLCSSCQSEVTTCGGKPKYAHEKYPILGELGMVDPRTQSAVVECPSYAERIPEVGADDRKQTVLGAMKPTSITEATASKKLDQPDAEYREDDLKFLKEAAEKLANMEKEGEE